LKTPLMNIRMENAPSHMESSIPSTKAIDEVMVIVLEKNMVAQKRPTIISSRLNRNLI